LINKVFIATLTALLLVGCAGSDKYVDSLIVIDAGHGGKDPGAVASNRRYEKNIVLNISRYIKKELSRKDTSTARHIHALKKDLGIK